MNWYWPLSMREILVRGQFALAKETRIVNFLCGACSYLTAQDIELLPLPHNPDNEFGGRWRYAVRVWLLEAKCVEQNCKSPVKILVPTGRYMEPSDLRLYYYLWKTEHRIVCENGHPLAIPPQEANVAAKAILWEDKDAQS